MLVKPLYNECAAYVEDTKTLVVADLHIGIEYELYEEGAYVGSRVETLANKIIDLLRKTGARRLVVLGDLKHVIPSSPPSQKRDLQKFFEKLSLVDIVIVPGNHDGGIKKIVPKNVKVASSSGYVVEEKTLGLVHGHSWPSKEVIECSTVVAAHTHPMVELKDALGYSYFERCWVIARVDREKLREIYGIEKEIEFMIMPAFNPLCGGMVVNKEGIANPLSKIIDPGSMEVYLLDGSYLGKVKNLQI